MPNSAASQHHLDTTNGNMLVSTVEPSWLSTNANYPDTEVTEGLNHGRIIHEAGEVEALRPGPR